MSRRGKPARKTRRALPRNALAVVALAVFIAVDIVLIALALGAGRQETQAAAPVSPTQIARSSEDPDQTESVDRSLSDENVNSPQVAPRLLSVVSDAVAWRSAGGACDERGELELTIDGGQSWGAAYPSVDGLGRPLWVSGVDYTTVQSMLASGADCGLVGFRTFDSGASWTQDGEAVTNSVLVDPSDPSLVLWDGEVIEGPCGDINQVATTGGVTGVICGDGSLWNSPSGSIEWTESVIDNAVALGGSDGRWIAAVQSNDCEGLSLVEFDEESVEPLACAPTELEADAVLDVSGSVLWLWAGDQVMISTDLGRSFN